MFIARIRSLIRGLKNRSKVENEMAEEIRFHVEARANDLMGQGVSEREAYRRARVEFGSIEKYKEESRSARGLRFVDELRGDFRYAVRQLSRNKGFAATVILMLAVGIGANTVAFDQLNDNVIAKLPIHAPDDVRQVRYASTNGSFRRAGNMYQRPDGSYLTSFSYAAYQHVRDRSTSFSDLFLFGGPQVVNVGVPGKAESATAQLVSGNYFRGLGVLPVLGRTISPEDDKQGEASSSVAVLGYGFWQRVFAGDPGVVGRTIVVNGTPVVIVGVTPKAFAGLNRDWHIDLMLPMALQPLTNSGRDILHDAGNWTFLMFGRLRAGVGEERARFETETLLQSAVLASAPPTSYDPPKVSLVPMEKGFRSFDVSSFVILSAGVVGFVLLISCANIAGLLLARATSRRLENGTRLALGASRGRVIRQLLTESMLLSGVGGGAGVLFAYILSDADANLRVLGFAGALTIATGVIFGLGPALRATRIDVVTMLKEKPAGSYRRPSRFVSGKTLVTVQVALSLILLVGAGLLLRTIFNLNSQKLGFSPENLLVFRMNPSLNGYSGERLRNFYEEALARIQAVRGVASASISRWGVLTQASGSEGVCVPGMAPADIGVHPIAPRYFESMGITVLAGRDIEWSDRENRPRVALVNEAFAKRFFNGRSPVGHSFDFFCSRDRQGISTEIIGLVSDVKYFSVKYPAPATVYFPYRQGNESWMTFAVRTTRDSAAVLPAIRNVFAGMDPNLPIYDVATQTEWIRRESTLERMVAFRLVLFAGIAVLLACSGIYGTLAYLVKLRTSEIGIRMAIGAEQRDITKMVLRESFLPVSLGIVLGIAGALGLTRFVTSMLFNVAPKDPLTIAVAASFLLVAACLAAFIPARRASRISPMVALKYE
jgi:predicted permease